MDKLSRNVAASIHFTLGCLMLAPPAGASAQQQMRRFAVASPPALHLHDAASRLDLPRSGSDEVSYAPGKVALSVMGRLVGTGVGTYGALELGNGPWDRDAELGGLIGGGAGATAGLLFMGPTAGAAASAIVLGALAEMRAGTAVLFWPGNLPYALGVPIPFGGAIRRVVKIGRTGALESDMASIQRREVLSWSLYDFANSAFTTLIVTFIFSRYYAEVVAEDSLHGAILWTRAVNISAVTVAFLMPVLGAIADHSGRKKLFLLLATVQTIVFTALLFFAGPGDALWAGAVFVVANIGFEGGQVFYNGFLPEISDRRTMGRVSGFAWGLGYLGGLIALTIGLGMVTSWVGEADQLNVRASTLLVAAWYALFSIPMFLFVRERAERRRASVGEYLVIGLRRVGDTFRHLRTFGEAAKLLLARLLYNDGLTTLFTMASIYVGATLRMEFAEVLTLGIAINVAAGLGAATFGLVDDRIGGKRTIQITLVVLLVATGIGSLTRSTTGFWVAALLIGLMAGPNQSASRSLLSRFVPADKQAEFFGFFAFSGKLSSVAGPFLYGLLLTFTGSHRIAMGSIGAFFLLGFLILLRVDEAAGIRAAGA
ncbi:MAG: MFS transporter [Gemmatimonadota bacterium]